MYVWCMLHNKLSLKPLLLSAIVMETSILLSTFQRSGLYGWPALIYYMRTFERQHTQNELDQ